MLPSREEWRALVEACADAGVHLLADEVYRLLEYDEADRLPTGADSLERGISLGVMSKSFAMAGLRIGWLATRDRVTLERVAAFKDYTTICSSAPAEILALIALRARESVLARSRAIVAANLERMDRFFADRADDVAWVRPKAGSVAFPRLVRGGPIDRFAADLVEAEGILLLPGSVFGMGGDHFRLGLGRSDLPLAVERLEAFLDSRTAR
jgi:aspartate/methionine/tyrosine aminotransferase